MQAGRYRNAEPACAAHRRPAQRAFGGDVDGIGAALLPVAREQLRCRQAEAQAGVAGKSGTAHQHFVRGGVVFCLTRSHQVHLMAAPAQSLLQALYGQGDAIDLRWIGLGDDGVAHGGLPVFRQDARGR
ncbi:hypothetical protein D9M73_249920 [compost metagenome]